MYICPTYYPRIGGIATHVRNIAERLAPKHDVTVFVTNTIKYLSAREVTNGVKIQRFRCIAPNDSYNLSFSLSVAARKVDADIVHIHGYDDVTPMLTILFKNKRQKCVFTLHSAGTSSGLRKALRVPYNLVMGKVMQNVDRIICVSASELDRFQRLLKLPKDKFVMIPNGVDCKKFQGKRPSRVSAFSLLSVGRLEKYKGHQWVLRGFKLFKALHPEVKIELRILGNGPYKSRLLNESKELGLERDVRFLSWLPPNQYLSLLKESSAVILLSDYESQSIAISESLCVGTPVIVAKNTALMEYVQQNLALGVTNPKDSYEVASKIEWTLLNPSICNAYGHNPLSWEDVVNKTIEVYTEILESVNRKPSQ